MTQPQRQGDVYFIPVPTVPASTRLEARGGQITVAEGEAPGHHHAVLDAPGVEVYQATAHAAERYIRATAPVTITHPEHVPPLVLPPGDYQVLRKREYAYGQSRQLAD